MIKANELRIENLLNLNGFNEVLKVEEIFFQGDWTLGFKDGRQSKIGRVEPIPITEEWLIKFGFSLFPWGWVKKSKSDFGVRLNLKSFSYSVSGNNPVSLQFVHQLQNLFFCLTGEELEVSLK